MLAVGLTIDMGGWKLYGGPFYYHLSGDIDASHKTTSTTPPGGTFWTGKASGDIKADSNFGGYIGSQFSLADNCDFTIELSATGDGWGLGTGITFKL